MKANLTRYAVTFGLTAIVCGAVGYKFGQYRAENAAAKPLIKGIVLGNYDGDTLAVQISVRLAEIDAPDLKQEHGQESKVELAKLLPPKTPINMLLGPMFVDQDGRLIAYVELAKPIAYGNVNRQMVIKGAAWQHEHSQDRDFRQAAAFAVVHSIGLWDSETSPLPPWEFREQPSNSFSGLSSQPIGSRVRPIPASGPADSTRAP